MKVKDVLKEIITLFHHNKLAEITSRNLSVPTNLNKVIVLMGVRRSGKTYMFYNIIKQLVSEGIDKHNIVYINFEDERLDMQQADLDLILQSYRELYPEKELNKVWFFFDEIQNVTGWEKFVRRLYDSVSTKIFITGSNSAFLSTDIATSLRGRSISYEVFPYSFDEYLRHLKIDVNLYLPKNKALVINAYYSYLKNGGFPEVVDYDDRLRSEVLKNYFYVMLYKDLIERYNISTTVVLKQFVEQLAVNVTSAFSINKIYNDFRSRGLKLDKNLLYELSEYIENIYLAFRVSKFDYSVNKRNVSSKKSYFIDNGLLNTLTFNFSDNYGKLLENAVYLYLKQNHSHHLDKSIFYHKSTKECDFVLFKGEKVVTAIQVSHDISDDETKARELDGLVNALKVYGLKKGYIITSETEDSFDYKGFEIEVIPAYKFLVTSVFEF